MLILFLALGFPDPPGAPCEAQREKPTVAAVPMETQWDVKVLVLNFDPIITSRGGRRLHSVCNWNDPRELAREYASDVAQASGGYISYKIVEWKDLSVFPPKKDGFVYTEDSYLQCHETNKGWHQPDEMDYPKVLETYGVPEKINKGEIDEVWLFGGPYFGFWESAMAGPGSFDINGGVYPSVKTQRPFAIMGFNYERGVAEMLHNLCHRTEATMTRIYGGWQADKLDHLWARFAANARQSRGYAGVGSCHYPPNAEKEYDYANPRFVKSTANDWLNFPHLTGAMQEVNCESWGGPDYHRRYLIWWFSRLPRAPGWNPDGRLNNWWKYVFDFNSYDERGLPKSRKPDDLREKPFAQKSPL